MAKGIYPPLRLVDDFEKLNSLLWECFRNVPEDLKQTGEITEMVDNIKKQFVDKGLTVENHRLLYHYVTNLYIIEEWRKQKQVYVFPDEMFKIFCKETEDFDMDKKVFDYLPYKSIYLELNGYRGYHGMIMKYCKFEREDNMLFILIKNDGVTYRTLNFIFKEGEKFSDSIDRFIVDEDKDDVKSIMAFGFQAAMYLCAKNCDIEENSITKGTYKHGETIKNKFSEIRKWDVAERVVQEYKKSLEKLEESEQNEEDLDTTVKGTQTKRKSPRMHWRKAHWQRYWVGKGRTKLVWKFIPPGIVNSTDDIVPIVKHV